ncbi:MAG: hypothetical protein JSV39_03460 [Candidatus Aenigmatarchaeota archaeon]|nr:MAG: hypothetical protein JSV39_03460 [Candidatus Aenigmarchaeota archaeon]
MDKKGIIGRFLKRGILLSPEELEEINEENYMQILESRGGATEKKERIVVEPKGGKITPDEFIKTQNTKFEFLREILLKKIEAVSINKGRKVFSEVAIIGRVKELTGRGFVVEDVTGETEVVTENEETGIGDVLGAMGFFKENCFFPKQIIWPDVPLENTPNTPGKSITLTTKLKEGMKDVVVCPDAKPSENVVTGFDKFGVVKITKGGSEIRILVFSPDKEKNEDGAVRILKKRTVEGGGVVDDLIKEIPDIFWLFNNKRNWTKNYRGVVIISNDENSFAEYGEVGVRFGKI